MSKDKEIDERGREDRPLFIPTRREFFDAFETGDKRSELRKYGPRWNERTCAVGRAVTLSCGYGKTRRLHGRVREFHKRRGHTFGKTYRGHIMAVYGTLEIDIAEIRIDLPLTTQETRDDNPWIALDLPCAICGDPIEAQYDHHWRPRLGYVDSEFTPLLYRHAGSRARECPPRPSVAQPYAEDAAMRRYRDRAAQEPQS